MNFYNRKIQYYKSFKLIDSNGDGIKDTISYSPISNFYYIQFALEQDVKDIGYYSEFENAIPEIIELSSILNEEKLTETATAKKSNVSVLLTSGTTVSFCNDPNASNYDPSLIGVSGFMPCEDRECCTYSKTKSYIKNKNIEEDLNCLAFYTNWGPWNNDLIFNDTKQTYIKKIDCSFSLRLINELEIENEFVEGGWYGASIKIEVDEGLGFKTLQPGNPIINNIDKDIIFNQEEKTFTLSNKVRIWKVSSNTSPNKYYTTKPYRDISFKPSNNSKIRVTYINSNTNISRYEKYAKNLRLQIIKGYIPVTVQTPPTPSTILSGYTWAQNIQNIYPLLGNPLDRQNDGETFHFISDGSVSTKYTTWQNYLDGYKTQTNLVPWGPSSTDIETGSFYTNPSVSIIDDFGDTKEKSIIKGLNYFNNPHESLNEYDFVCQTKENYISFYDRNGDGFIESNENGSVDEGLFSKTRYDSPYIYIKPGTRDGVESLTDNPLTKTLVQQRDFPIGPSSTGGWKNYAYVPTPLLKSLNTINKYSFSNVSPTCQLGGVDNLTTIDVNMVDGSNANIFLQQPYNNNSDVNYATFGTGTTVPHSWNYGFNSSKGGCCAKKYDTTLDISTSGPYLEGKCSNCHSQMTTRSAQPVLENTIRLAMQTTDSDIYYGPFYDPQNPTYNGYGLAFSKANKFCREIKGKNGVQVINSEPGVDNDELFIGGILHGGGVQYTPNTDLSDNYGVITSLQLGFDTVGVTNSTSTCINGSKLPLKCFKAIDDPNCPNNNCMKCIFCFKCNTEEKQSGVFTGNNSDLKGPTDGINYLG